MSEEITPPQKTIMMQVIENLNKGIVPTEYPSDGFLTAENLHALVEAINYNKSSPLLLSYALYFPYQGYNFEVHYMPFDMYEGAVLVSSDFVFHLGNVSRGPYESNNTMRTKIEQMNMRHCYISAKGYDLYYLKDPWGMFYESPYTKTNHKLNPIELKTKILDFSPSVVTLHDVFKDVPEPISHPYDPSKPFWEHPPTIYAFNSGQTIRQSPDVIKFSNMKKFKHSTVPDSYYNGNFFYANPFYGYEDYNEISPFWGGGKTTEWVENELFGSSLGIIDKFAKTSFSLYGNYNPYTSRLAGYIFYRGFEVVDIRDDSFVVKDKYLLVYRDRGSFDPTLCCLAQCFGITK